MADEQIDWLVKARQWAGTDRYGLPPKTNLDAIHAFSLMSIAEDLRKLVDFLTVPLLTLEPQTAGRAPDPADPVDYGADRRGHGVPGYDPVRAPDDFDTNPVAWPIRADENPANYD